MEKVGKMMIPDVLPTPEVKEAMALMAQHKICGFRLLINKPKNPDKILLEEGSFIPEGEIDVLDKIKEGFKEGNACWGVCKIDFVKMNTETKCPHYFLISWTSDHANVNLRMATTCSKGCVRMALGDLVQNELQVNSLEDLDVNLLQSKCGTLSKEELSHADGRRLRGKHGHYQKVYECDD